MDHTIIQVLIILILGISISWGFYLYLHKKNKQITNNLANLSFFEHATMLVSDYVFEQSPNEAGGYDLIWTSDSQVSITGYTIEEINEIGWLNIMHKKDRKEGTFIEKQWHQGINTTQEFRIISKQGETIWLVNHSKPILIDGKLTKIIGVSTDITKVKIAEEQLKYWAYFDVLTGLYNRTKIIDLLNNYILDAKVDLTILSLDLDQFKNINDSLGHSIGDKLLVAVTEWLQQNLESIFQIGRFGGDEFIIIIPGTNNDQIVMEAIQKIQNRFSRPFNLENYQVFTSASIGVSTHSANQPTTPEFLIRNADIAMFKAKQVGPNRFMFFDKDMHLQVEEKLVLETDLRFAIKNEELLIHYQPIVSLIDGKTLGVEALLRWRHPHLGMVSPTKFIKVAEEIGVIVEIGDWVIEQTMKQLVDWKKNFALPENFYISINISATQLFHSVLINFLDRAIKKHKLHKNEIRLELTENVFLFENINAIEKINELIESGYKIILDDFGTGYSSLSYLIDIKFDAIKLDRSFVKQLEDKKNKDWVIAIARLFGTMEAELIVEGIEGEEQIQHLLNAGCKYGQGYYYSYPLPAKRIEQSLFRE